MDKLLTKVARLALGLSLAAGVGVAIGSNKAQRADATATDSTNFSLINSTSDLEAGKSYIITNGTSGTVKAIATTANNNNRKTTAVTVSNDKITRGSSVMSFTLGGSSGAWTFKCENYATSGDLYLASAASGSNNYLRCIADAGTASISFSSDAAVITIGPHTSRNIIRYNTSDLFACYSTGQNPIYLWKEVASGGTCTHNWVAGTVHPATCTEAGYTEYECSLCHETKQDDEVSALGHSYGEWTITTAATCTEAGEQRRVCSRDNTHIETQAIPALGHS